MHRARTIIFDADATCASAFEYDQVTEAASVGFVPALRGT